MKPKRVNLFVWSGCIFIVSLMLMVAVDAEARYVFHKKVRLWTPETHYGIEFPIHSRIHKTINVASMNNWRITEVHFPKGITLWGMRIRKLDFKAGPVAFRVPWKRDIVIDNIPFLRGTMVGVRFCITGQKPSALYPNKVPLNRYGMDISHRYCGGTERLDQLGRPFKGTLAKETLIDGTLLPKKTKLRWNRNDRLHTAEIPIGKTVLVQGVSCVSTKKNNQIRFDYNGKLVSCMLSKPQKIAGVLYEGNFRQTVHTQNTVLGEATVLNDIELPAHTTVAESEWHISYLLPRNTVARFKGLVCKSKLTVTKPERSKAATEGKKGEVTCASVAPETRIKGVSLSENTSATFYPDGSLKEGILAAAEAAVVDNLKLKPGSAVQFYPSGKLAGGVIDENSGAQLAKGFPLAPGALFSLHETGWPKKATGDPASVPLIVEDIPIVAGEMVGFYSNGKLRYAVISLPLATEVLSLSSKSAIQLSRSGRLIQSLQVPSDGPLFLDGKGCFYDATNWGNDCK